MQINDFFQTNDRKPRKFLTIILSIQISVIGFIFLGLMGIDIPILREMITFVYLAFIPGILILKILKINVNTTKSLLYSVGLSIFTLMITGLFINIMYPWIGISKPISLIPLITAISTVVLFLCSICYIKNRNVKKNSLENPIKIKDLVSVPALLLCSLPFLSIFGTYLVNFYENNILLMLLLILICLIVILIGFNKLIPKELFPLAIFTISISILFHTSLISQFIWGIDIHGEYHFSNLVLQSGSWNMMLVNPFNSVVSTNLIAPMFSILLNLSLELVFKIIYPFLFALVPLGLYYFFKEQTSEKIAFLSCFFFISLFVFYNDMIALARQEIAELFLILLVMVVMAKNINGFNKSILAIIFVFSLVISHYGLSYIYMALFLAVWFLGTLIEKIPVNKNRISNLSVNLKNESISITFVLLFIILTISWYMYISNSYNFDIAVKVLNNILGSVTSDFLNPDSAQGLELLIKTSSFVHNAAKYLHILFQLFIGLGIIKVVLYSGKLKMKSEYKMFSILNFGILIAAITMPYFAGSFNTSRLYHIALIFLAPMCIIGGITFLNILNNIFKFKFKNIKGVLAIMLSIFLLFNAGFIYEVTNDSPSSISLSQKSIDNGDIRDKGNFYAVLNTFEQDILSINWLNRNINSNNMEIYADYISTRSLLSHGKISPEHQKNLLSGKFDPNSFIFLGYSNVINGVIVGLTKGKYPVFKTADMYPSLEKNDKVYTNGGGEIYWVI